MNRWKHLLAVPVFLLSLSLLLGSVLLSRWWIALAAASSSILALGLRRLGHRREAGALRLRAVVDADLPVFFEQQREPEANEMANFPARDEAAFYAHWQSIRALDSCLIRTIVLGERVAGNVASFEQGGRRLVGYWVGSEFWGRGIATEALTAFLRLESSRPLEAYVSKENPGSMRVLEKCGFVRSTEEAAEGHLYRLGDDASPMETASADGARRGKLPMTPP